MCLNSQIDTVRPLHFYRAMGNRFQSTQTVVEVVVDFRWKLEIIDSLLQFTNQSTTTVLHKEETFFGFFIASCDIFCSVRRVIIIFFTSVKNFLEQPFTYLQHAYRMRKKFYSGS